MAETEFECGAPHGTRVDRDIRIRLVRMEIDNRYYSISSWRHLATVAQMSPEALARSFERAYGLSPRQYLLRVRVQRAKRLIQHSRQPLEVISTAVGFSSTLRMESAFLEIEKESVSRYCQAMPSDSASRSIAVNGV